MRARTLPCLPWLAALMYERAPARPPARSLARSLAHMPCPPSASPARAAQVESDHYERVQMRCQQERVAQHRMHVWGSRESARDMPMPGCSELGALNERLGLARQRVGAW